MPRRSFILSDSERQERRDATRERLEAAARDLLTSDGWARWARARACFHRYSLGNTLLIAHQRSGATYVAGFRAWLKLDRAVRKGERAIRILGPIRRRVEDESTGKQVWRVVGYRDVAVFDISQTDPVPGADPVELTPPAWASLTGDSHAHLLPALERLAGERGYAVSYEKLPGALGGYCNTEAKRIVIDAAHAGNARVRTLIHELAHALGVTYQTHRRDEAEVIVETVIFSPGWLEWPMAPGLRVGDGCHRRTSGCAVRRGCSGSRRGSALLLV